MPSYSYVARSNEGRELTGSMTGGNLESVVGQLHSLGLVVLHVTEDGPAEQRRQGMERFLPFSLRKASTRDLAIFTRQLATVFEAGIPLNRGLRGLSADFTGKVMARAISDLALRLERGESLSDAMALHPEAFSSMYVSMIQAGERAGTMSEILEELAVYMEKVDATRSKVQSALSYPIFVLVFALFSTVAMVYQVAPTMSKIYKDLGQQLPALTRVVLGVSDAVRAHALPTLGVLIVVFIGIYTWVRSKQGRLAIDTFALKAPIFGPIVRKTVMSRFARTFGILARSGLPVLDGLELVKGAAGNRVVIAAIEDARSRITGGQGITSAFRSTGKFPEMVLQLMATGEESGQLDTMLLKSSDFYDRQVEASMQTLTSLIEPVMIVFIGGLVGTLVISMFLPIFKLGDAVMKGGFRY